MTVTSTSLAYALKTLWPQSRVQNEVYPDHPFLAMISKREDFYGDSMYIAVRTGDPQGRSAGFSTAQTISQVSGGAGSQRGVRFLITRATDYQLVSLGTEVMLASERDEGSLLRALDTEMKAGINNIGKSAATALFRGQSGNLARIGAISANTTVSADITLANINDVTSFEVGMLLVASATSTGANRATPASAYVATVNRDTGVVNVLGDFSSTNWSASSSGDFLSSSGDNANNSGSGNKMQGLIDWLPSSTPSATTFNGVDRSVDPTRLAGLRIDVSSLAPEEGWMTVLSKQAREGGSPNYSFVNHLDYRNIMIALGSKVENEYVQVGDIGFETLKIRGPKGVVAVVADQDCPSGRGYSLDMRTWKLASLKGMPMILDQDGSQLSRTYNADSFEARIAYFANTYCDAPGFNANVTLPT